MKNKFISNRFSLRHLESFDVLSPYGRAERLGGPENGRIANEIQFCFNFLSQFSNRKMLVFGTFSKFCLKNLEFFVAVIPKILSF